MRNKFNYNELVKISGSGKIYGNIKDEFGFILEKDMIYGDYYVELFNKKKDWFNEKDIKRVFNKKRNKTEKYQIRLCTTKEGFELIKEELKEKEPISNNKFNKINMYKKFIKDNKEYIILGWKSVFWPVSNKSIKILEDSIRKFKQLDIPYQYIVMNEERLTDIEIYEFIDNDSNVNIFEIERKIKKSVKNDGKDKK